MSMIEKLNHPLKEQRLLALSKLTQKDSIDGKKPNIRTFDINNHIHTFYSFSPYSPTMAAYYAYQAGLELAGIVDHDTLSGIKEFHEAASIIGIAATGGVEMRVKFPPFKNQIINNPDQVGCMYMVAHGVPIYQLDAFDAYLKPYRAHREQRNRKMINHINHLIRSIGLKLDYEKDVRMLSKVLEGGTVTERHLLFALAKVLLNQFKDIDDMISFIERTFDLTINRTQKERLTQVSNAWLPYDLMAVLKTNTNKYYVEASEELPEAHEFVEKAISFGAIPAYAYLGDIESSVTQDKRKQNFEDSYLDDLMKELKKINVPAIAYMPTRNTPSQIERVQKLAKQHGFMEISGEDINQPRQAFTCDAYQKPSFHHLIETSWALIGHEVLSNQYPYQGWMGKNHEHLSIKARIQYFAQIGRKSRIEK
jgi:hypothetical protein